MHLASLSRLSWTGVTNDISRGFPYSVTPQAAFNHHISQYTYLPMATNYLEDSVMCVYLQRLNLQSPYKHFDIFSDNSHKIERLRGPLYNTYTHRAPRLTVNNLSVEYLSCVITWQHLATQSYYDGSLVAAGFNGTNR